jgi:hypothetical protein
LRAFLCLAHIEHMDRFDAADLAAVVDGVRGDQADAVLTLGHDSTSGQPAVERPHVAGARAGVEDAVLIADAVTTEGVGGADRAGDCDRGAFTKRAPARGANVVTRAGPAPGLSAPPALR